MMPDFFQIDSAEFDKQPLASCWPHQSSSTLPSTSQKPLFDMISEILCEDFSTVPSYSSPSPPPPPICLLPWTGYATSSDPSSSTTSDEFEVPDLSSNEFVKSEHFDQFHHSFYASPCEEEEEIDVKPVFKNSGPVCVMGPNGLKLINRSNARGDFSSRHHHAHRRNASSSSTSSSSSEAGKRRSTHRLSPLPKHWSEELLRMPTKELNQYLKLQNYTSEEICQLKTCRRRIKNRGYTRQSRQRKTPKDEDPESPC